MTTPTRTIEPTYSRRAYQHAESSAEFIAVACCAYCTANVPADWHCKRCGAFVCESCDDGMTDLCEECRIGGVA